MSKYDCSHIDAGMVDVTVCCIVVCCKFILRFIGDLVEGYVHVLV